MPEGYELQMLAFLYQLYKPVTMAWLVPNKEVKSRMMQEACINTV